MIAPEINKGIATLVICLFVTGTVCGFALATLQIALKPEVEIPACKPLPSAGQCAYDGAGVYCLLPAEKVKPRWGEKK